MKTCKKCGENFGCGMNSPDQECWCKSLPSLKNIPKQFKDCLCPKCLNAFVDPSKLKEGEDFYMEGPLLVFTERYHLKKGY